MRENDHVTSRHKQKAGGAQEVSDDGYGQHVVDFGQCSWGPRKDTREPSVLLELLELNLYLLVVCFVMTMGVNISYLYIQRLIKLKRGEAVIYA